MLTGEALTNALVDELNALGLPTWQPPWMRSTVQKDY